MDILLQLPVIVWGVFAFVVGTGVGSFLNVLVARLPYEKSIIWPGSRCASCLRPLRKFDNLPIVGYLRLRGRCRFCGERFSIVYMLFEVGVGLVFLGLFLLDVVWNWHNMPGLRDSTQMLAFGVPAWEAVAVLVVHATLASLLIAAAGIDAVHRVIPPQITYVGVVLGLIASTALPWPWPSMEMATMLQLPVGIEWALPLDKGKIPIGVMPWPFWEPPSWAPAGSWQLGLLNGLVGAMFGTFLVRAFKALFEIGFGREALGLGDADLMMMAGAFLGWQIVLLSFFAGAVVSLFLKVPMLLIDKLRGGNATTELSFGPGLALGVALVWLAWPWIGEPARLLFDSITLIVVSVVMGGGLLFAGLLMRR